MALFLHKDKKINCLHVNEQVVFSSYAEKSHHTKFYIHQALKSKYGSGEWMSSQVSWQRHIGSIR
jgi:hypothetical protein